MSDIKFTAQEQAEIQTLTLTKKRTADPTRNDGMRPAFASLNTVLGLMFSIAASCFAVSAPFTSRAIL